MARSKINCPNCGSTAVRMPSDAFGIASVTCLKCGAITSIDLSEWSNSSPAQWKGKTASLGRRSILVLEDDGATALDLANLVRDHGEMVVGPAATVGAALTHLMRTPIHCALLDVKLAHGDCGEVAQALAAKVVPFVFVTGYSHSEVVSRYSRSPVITKPYAPVDVINSLRFVLAA